MARTRTISQPQQATLPTYDHSETGVAFSQGVMYVNGSPQIPARVQHWLSTNENSQYATTEWRDPATGQLRTSCNCPGWTIRRKGAAHRECCHTKDMEGVATCDRKRVESGGPLVLNTLADVERHVESISNTRELRAIMID